MENKKNVLKSESDLPGENKIRMEIIKAWDEYAPKYSSLYRLSCIRKIKSEIEKMFSLASSGGVILDAGCGAGQMFVSIQEKMHPSLIVAADISEKMLQEAKNKATSDNIRTQIEFCQADFTKKFVWPDSYFDGQIHSLTICYLNQDGWQNVIKESYRVMKPGGLIFVSTFLEGNTKNPREDFSNVVKKHLLEEFVRSPLGLIHGLRISKYPAMVLELGKEIGVEFPEKNRLLGYVEKTGFKIIAQKDIFWKAGIAFVAVANKNNS